jgi:predicted transglutaminase-like cysteine proteinase
MLHRITTTGLTMLSAAAIAGPAVASETGAGRSEMMEGVVVDAPRGYVEMCARDASLCEALASDGSNEGLDPRARFKMLRAINHFVNEHVRQASDESTVGKPEVWRRPGTGRRAAGDCEDIAIEKRLRLIAAGFPAHDLFFATGLARGLGMHAVLVARTDRGDVVLDSLSPAISSWAETPYIWVSRQAPGQPDRWESAMPLLPDAGRMQLASAALPQKADVETDPVAAVATARWTAAAMLRVDTAALRIASLATTPTAALVEPQDALNARRVAVSSPPKQSLLSETGLAAAEYEAGAGTDVDGPAITGVWQWVSFGTRSDAGHWRVIDGHAFSCAGTAFPIERVRGRTSFLLSNLIAAPDASIMSGQRIVAADI